MRARNPMFCMLLAAAASLSARAEEQFPYTAYVNADDVYIRSGPGQNYYPTSKLQVGESVEVYRHDPGGWYAIRPPQGSFCWVSTRYLKLGQDNIATIDGDRVVARVGSSFSDIRDVIQVRLERGEEVEVLETKLLDAAQGGEKWAKVAPVPGEFRWVLGKYLDRTRPEPELTAGRSGRNVLLSSQREDPSVANRSDAAERASAARTASASASQDEAPTKSAFRPIRSSEGKTKPVSFSSPDSEEPRKLPAVEKELLEKEPLFTRRTRTTGNTANEEDFQTQLDQIDLEISRMVAEEPTVWDFGDLHARAETAVSRAQTAVERGRARLVLAKIERFQEIKDRFERVAAVKTKSTDGEATLASAVAAPASAQAAIQPDPLSRFDGAGRLTSIVSLRIGTPHFALVDNNGMVRTYVTPAPGVNLRPYIGREVGINGNRGFMQEFNAQHLTARQIMVLEQGVLR